MTDEKIKARDRRGRATRTPAQVTRDVRAAELRSKSLTYQQIATELGLETAAGAYQAVQRGIREIPTEGAAEARRIELAKLDTVERAAWAILEAHHFVMIESGPKAGTIIYHPQRPAEPLTDPAPVLAAIDRIVRTSERRSKLMGLDAPRETLHHVISEDLIDSEIRRLEAELAGNDPSPTGEAAQAGRAS